MALEIYYSEWLNPWKNSFLSPPRNNDQRLFTKLPLKVAQEADFSWFERVFRSNFLEPNKAVNPDCHARSKSDPEPISSRHLPVIGAKLPAKQMKQAKYDY